MSVLITSPLPRLRTSLRLPALPTPLARPALMLAEEPHFDPRAVRRALREIEREVTSPRFPIRSELAGYSVAEARRALAGLPSPGDYRVVIKPLRYRTRPHLAGLCEFDVHRIVLNVPVPFRPFDELVYYRAKRRPGPGMRFTWFAERVRFRTRRDVLRFVYLHEWLHWYLREEMGRRSGAETACDRFALRNFRRRAVTVEDAFEALRGCRTQPLPDFYPLAA
jgi:hypothetical protein